MDFTKQNFKETAKLNKVLRVLGIGKFIENVKNLLVGFEDLEKGPSLVVQQLAP